MSSVAPIIISFICTILCLIPIPWHYRSGNIPTVANMIWIGQGNFFRGISAILWYGSVERKALVYCDITLQMQIASIWGMTACAVCITRHLEAVSSQRFSSSGLNDERNRKLFEIFMCVICPWIFAAVHLIVQGHRFDIIEDIGCASTTYWSWASIWLFYAPPLILSVATSIYSALTFRWFIKRRAQFHDLLSSSGFSSSRYLRLMLLAFAEFLGTAISNSYVISAAAESPLRPWISWDNVHSDFKRVDQYPMAILPKHTIHALWGTWSLYPIASVLFFAFFGFGQEAVAEYKKSWQWVKTTIFRRRGPQPHVPGNVSLPSFVASGSMASREKGYLGESQNSNRSFGASQKWDPTLTLDIDDDSLYDADERRGRRSVALGDLESTSPTTSFDEKAYAPSLTPSSPNTEPDVPAPPPMPALPPAVHQVALTRTSSIEESLPPTPRAF